MSPELARALQDLENATGDMSDHELAWRPEGKWSTGDILEHLSLAFSGTIKGAQIALEKNSPRKREPTLRERLRVLVVVGLGHFPRGRKSPEVVKPHGVPPREAFHSIRQNLIAMDGLLTACEERFGSKTRLSAHPVLGPITARQWRRFHCIHTGHHMRQVRALRQRMRQAGAKIASAS
jgi:uncharacterized protein DUF1569